MKDRPILFQADMVRALLNGSKTQTRRVVNGQAIDSINFMSNSAGEQDGSTEDLGQGWHEGQLKVWSSDYPDLGSESIRSPYGQPGDRLWVREAWRTHKTLDNFKPSELAPSCGIWHEAHGPAPEWMGKLRPSMFMPRWASRITLEITGVRVERLQDLSEADAQAEGVVPCARRVVGLSGGCDSHLCGYRQLWSQINGKGSWAANPWVWVVEFKRVDGGAA